MHFPSPSRTSPYRFVVAARLLRTRRINWISVAGIALGVLFLVLLISVMEGYQRKLRDVIRGTLSDAVMEVERLSADAGDPSTLAASMPGVAAASYQLQTVALLHPQGAGPRHFLPLRLIGVDLASERHVSKLESYMEDATVTLRAEGNAEARAEAKALPRILLSGHSAKELGAAAGSRIRLRTFEEAGPADGNGAGPGWTSVEHEAVVAGLYRSENFEYDRLHAYVDRESNEDRFFKDGAGLVREIRIRFEETADPRAVLTEMIELYREHPAWSPVGVDTWEERQEFFLRMIRDQEGALGIVMFFIVLVGCFSIFATLTLTAAEKRRDIGVLKALGATPSGILGIFVWNAALISAAGVCVGYAFGLLAVAHINDLRVALADRGWDVFPESIYLFPEIPTYVNHRSLLPYVAGAVLAAVVFAIVPALRAARIPPVRALAHE